MRRLNRKYRKKDRPTDVLAFPIREAAMPASTLSLLGDVVISLPTAVRQARKPDDRSTMSWPLSGARGAPSLRI